MGYNPLCFVFIDWKKKKPKKPHLCFVESHKQNVFALVVFCVVLLRLFQIILTNFSVYSENFKVSFLLEKDGYQKTPDTFSDFSRFLRYLCVCVCVYLHVFRVFSISLVLHWFEECCRLLYNRFVLPEFL